MKKSLDFVFIISIIVLNSASIDLEAAHHDESVKLNNNYNIKEGKKCEHRQLLVTVSKSVNCLFCVCDESVLERVTASLHKLPDVIHRLFNKNNPPTPGLVRDLKESISQLISGLLEKNKKLSGDLMKKALNVIVQLLIEVFSKGNGSLEHFLKAYKRNIRCIYLATKQCK